MLIKNPQIDITKRMKNLKIILNSLEIEIEREENYQNNIKTNMY